MNQTQVNDFLMCLSRIDDINYLSLHNQIQRNNNQLHLADHYFFDKNNANEKEHDHDHDHDHEHDHDHDHNLLIAKVTAMIVLFIASAICGSIPFLLNIFFKFTETHANARSATVVKCLLYFGGGVLLSTTFLHLLPEVQETVAQLQECGHIGELTFALAELLMCSGFFLMYLIEETLHSYIHRNKKILHDDTAAAAFERGHSLRNSFLLRKGNEANSIKDDTKITSAPLTYSNESQRNDVSVISLEKEPDNLRYETNKHCHGHKVDQGSGHSHLPNAAISTDDPHMITSSLRGFFIVLALSIHELFEGMAIGLEGSSSTVWLMFGAVSAHKLVLAFCVGVELIVAKTRTSLAVAYVFLFAVVSPMGIGIGILISKNHETDSPNITAVVLQGLACGTLLYVVFFEILSKNHGGLLAYFSLLIGFLVMFGMQQLGATGHGHSHDGCDPHEHSKNVGHNDSAGYNFEKKLQQLRHAAKIILPTKNNHNS